MVHLNGSLPETVAAVDLGSTSFHLIVARPHSDQLVVVDRLREMVQLASGLDSSRRLSQEARDRALACLRRFGERVGHLPRERVRAVGTNTLRSAKNARRFLTEARSALGHYIETISGMEEARLIFLGVTQSLPDPGLRRLVLDIGGGSTELIVGEAMQPILMESLYLGCVTLSRRYFEDGEITQGRWRKAELAALQEMEPFQGRYRKAGWEQAVGASGTVRAVDAVVRSQEWSKEGITMKSLKRLRDAMLKSGRVNGLEGISPERVPVFPGGVVLLLAAFEALGIETMQTSEGALREGLLHDLLGRIGDKDVRTRSVSSLADRFHVDREQASRVERTAMGFLSQMEAAWDLGSRGCRQLLSWAALLHEIGLDIAHQQYHKHGEYIIAQADLPGFSRDEQRMLALLVRAHRRRFPESLLKGLPPPWSDTAERLAILLRLAVALHRSRGPDPLPDLSLQVEETKIRLRLPEGWLDERPLTRADLDSEASLLADAGYALEIA